MPGRARLPESDTCRYFRRDWAAQRLPLLGVTASLTNGVLIHFENGCEPADILLPGCSSRQCFPEGGERPIDFRNLVGQCSEGFCRALIITFFHAGGNLRG